MYALDPLERILKAGKITLRRVHEERIAALPSSVVGSARSRALSENLKRPIVAEANDLGTFGSDYIAHPEDRRVTVLDVNKISRMLPSPVASMRFEQKRFGDRLQARRSAGREDNTVLIRSSIEVTQNPRLAILIDQVRDYALINIRSFVCILLAIFLSPISRALDDISRRRTGDTDGVRVRVETAVQIGSDVPDLRVRIQSCARMIHITLF